MIDPVLKSRASECYIELIEDRWVKPNVPLSDIKEWEIGNPKTFDVIYKHLKANQDVSAERKPHELVKAMREVKSGNFKIERIYQACSPEFEERHKLIDIVSAQKGGVFTGMVSTRSERLHCLCALSSTSEIAAQSFVADVPQSSHREKIELYAKTTCEQMLRGEADIMNIEAVSTATDVYDAYFRLDDKFARGIIHGFLGIPTDKQRLYSNEFVFSGYGLVLHVAEDLFDVELEKLSYDEAVAIAKLAYNNDKELEKDLVGRYKDRVEFVLMVALVQKLVDYESLSEMELHRIVNSIAGLMEDDMFDPEYYLREPTYPDGVLSIGDIADSEYSIDPRFCLGVLCRDYMGSTVDVCGHFTNEKGRIHNTCSQVVFNWMSSPEANSIHSEPFVSREGELSELGLMIYNASRRLIIAQVVSSLREEIFARRENEPWSPYPLSIVELIDLDFASQDLETIVGIYSKAIETFKKTIEAGFVEYIKTRFPDPKKRESKILNYRKVYGTYFPDYLRTITPDNVEAIYNSICNQIGVQPRALLEQEKLEFNEYIRVKTSLDSRDPLNTYFLTPRDDDEVRLVEELFGDPESEIAPFSTISENFASYDFVIQTAVRIWGEEGKEIGDRYYKKLMSILVDSIVRLNVFKKKAEEAHILIHKGYLLGQHLAMAPVQRAAYNAIKEGGCLERLDEPRQRAHYVEACERRHNLIPRVDIMPMELKVVETALLFGERLDQYKTLDNLIEILERDVSSETISTVPNIDDKTIEVLIQPFRRIFSGLTQKALKSLIPAFIASEDGQLLVETYDRKMALVSTIERERLENITILEGAWNAVKGITKTGIDYSISIPVALNPEERTVVSEEIRAISIISDVRRFISEYQSIIGFVEDSERSFFMNIVLESRLERLKEFYETAKRLGRNAMWLSKGLVDAIKTKERIDFSSADAQKWVDIIDNFALCLEKTRGNSVDAALVEFESHLEGQITQAREEIIVDLVNHPLLLTIDQFIDRFGETELISIAETILSKFDIRRIDGSLPVLSLLTNRKTKNYDSKSLVETLTILRRYSESLTEALLEQQMQEDEEYLEYEGKRKGSGKTKRKRRKDRELEKEEERFGIRIR